MLEFDQLFIGGRCSAPAGREQLEVVSPTTEQVIGQLPAAETTDMDRAVAGDVRHGLEVARKIRTGSVTVNDFCIASGMPFGGFKCSGIGREDGPEGVGAYLEYKSLNLPPEGLPGAGIQGSRD